MNRWQQCALALFLLADCALGQNNPALLNPGLDVRDAQDGAFVGLQIHNTEPHADASLNETGDVEFYFDTDLVARIRVIKLDDYDPTTAEHDSAMVFSTDRDGTLTEAGRFLSTGGLNLDIGQAFGPNTGFCLGDGNTCIYEGSDNILKINIGGNERFVFQNSQALFPDGSETSPGIAFTGQSGTGIERIGSGNIGFSMVGVRFFELGGSQTGLFQDTTPTTGNTQLVIQDGAGDTQANDVLVFKSNAGTALLKIRANNAALDWDLGASIIGGQVLILKAFNNSQTSGEKSGTKVQQLVNPSSGTAILNALEIDFTVNQTGGANGITRGVYCNPTLTASADFRCIDIVITTTDTVKGALIDLNQIDDADATDVAEALRIELSTTSTDAGDTLQGLVIEMEDAAGTTDVDNAIHISNLEVDDDSMLAAILIDGATDGITTGIDLSDDVIKTAAIVLGSNPITHTGGIVTTTDLDIIDDGQIDDTDMANETFGDFSCSGAEDGCTLDGDVVASAEISDGTVAPVDMTNAARDMKFSFNLADPVAGDDGDWHIESPACTLQEVHCNVKGGTNAVINIYERARATPETGTTGMLTSNLTCVTGGATSSTFTDAALAADVPLALGIISTSGTPTILRVYVKCRRD